MTYRVDPVFADSGRRARLERARAVRRRRLAALAGLGGLAALALIAALLLRLPGREAPATDGTAPGLGDAETLTQVEIEGADAREAPRPNAARAFLDLRGDPLVIRLPETEAGEAGPKLLPVPEALDPARAGPAGTLGLALIADDLLQTEQRLVTTIPSSRADLALFEAHRGGGAEAAARGGFEPAPVPRAAVDEAALGEGTLVVADGAAGSWGDALPSEGVAGERVSFVRTRVADTTSWTEILPESRRRPLFEDRVFVVRVARSLAGLLEEEAGYAPDDAGRIVRAAERVLDLPDTLPAGSLVALRHRPGPAGPTLLQMSLYRGDLHRGSLAQTGAGRFAPAADPFIDADLERHVVQIQERQPFETQVRLLDALYSAGLRNGLPTRLVGEMIVMMSEAFDLDRFAGAGDEVTILYAPEPPARGAQAAQILYVGIRGPVGEMECFVLPDARGGHACYRGPRGGGGMLANGMLVPVSGTKTSGYGTRRHPILKTVRVHRGVDWAAPIGTPVHAAEAGRVTFADATRGYGNVVYLAHENGVETRYAHLDGFAEGLAEGDRVARGDLIGFVGTTGYSTGPHLHFEVRVAGRAVDPLAYMGGTASAAVDALVDRIIKVESAGVADARNPLSTATGLGQFIERTWLRMMETYRPDLVASLSRAELLALRTEPEISREMTRNYARENEAYLRAAGHEITPGRLYLAHFLGRAGADRALTAAAEASVAEVMGARVVAANPFLSGKTIADLLAWSDRKMAGAGASETARAAAPRPGPEPREVTLYKETVRSVLAAL